MAPSLQDFEGDWYVREADAFRQCCKWRNGRKYLFNLDQKFNRMDFEKRVMGDRKLRGWIKETPIDREQHFKCERIRWNHEYPNWLNYKELHMKDKILL